ncbi:MAG: hypothetical protein PHN88_10465 [Ignavibacteria bacterium]|nr:hypothetical protein [Ignavibacteria bacterium]
MKNKESKKESSLPHTDKEKNDIFPGYQSYPDSEDIYNNSKEERDIDPEDISQTKKTDPANQTKRKKTKDIPENESGDGLDVPGSELDDEEENNGDEDEENNYYSLGGDDHDDLDEDKG